MATKSEKIINHLMREAGYIEANASVMTELEKRVAIEKLTKNKLSSQKIVVADLTHKWDTAIKAFENAESLHAKADSKALSYQLPEINAELNLGRTQAESMDLEAIESTWNRVSAGSNRPQIIGRGEAYAASVKRISNDSGKNQAERLRANSLYKNITKKVQESTLNVPAVRDANRLSDRAFAEVENLRPQLKHAYMVFKDRDLERQLSRVDVTNKIDENNPMHNIKTITIVPIQEGVRMPSGIKTLSGEKLSGVYADTSNLDDEKESTLRKI